MATNPLTTDWLGLELRSPVIVSASTITKYLRAFVEAEQAGAGAVATKGVQGTDPGYTAIFRATYCKEGLGWTGTGDRRLAPEEGEALIRAAKREIRIPVIANITGPGVDPDGWAALARRMERAGADAIEGIFCGLSGLELAEYYQDQGIEGVPRYAGAMISRHPEYLIPIVRAIKAETKVPFMAKISVEVDDMRALARTCEEAGADAITAIDGLRAFAGVDIFNGGRPMIPMDNQPLGGMCGNWVKPLTMRALVQIRQITNMPVSACSGIMTWEDAAQMFMLGANTVQSSSAIYLGGFKALRRMVDGLQRFLSEQGYGSLQAINGLGLPYIQSTAVLQVRPIVAEVDDAKCTLCDRCLDIGCCYALSREGERIVVDWKECIGCSLCYWLCPTGAINLRNVDDPAQMEALRRKDSIETFLHL